MQVKHILEKTAEKFGKVDGVACCVGSSLIKPAHLTHAQEFHDAIAKNTFSAFNILKASVSCPCSDRMQFYMWLHITSLLELATG